MCPAAAAALRTQRVAALRLHEPGEFPKRHDQQQELAGCHRAQVQIQFRVRKNLIFFLGVFWLAVGWHLLLVVHDLFAGWSLSNSCWWLLLVAADDASRWWMFVNLSLLLLVYIDVGRFAAGWLIFLNSWWLFCYCSFLVAEICYWLDVVDVVLIQICIIC